MPSIKLPVASYRHRSAAASSSRMVNAQAEALPQDAKTPYVVTRAPGLSQWASVGSGPVQALHTDHGLLYVVSGGVLYSVTSAAVATSLGTVASVSSDEIDIDSNEDTVVVVNPPDGYYYDGTFHQITDPDFTSRGAGDVEFNGDFLLFREPNSGRFFGADVGSASSFDALSFVTAEGSPDTLVGLKSDHDEVFAPGEKSCEIWLRAPIDGFPYQRAQPGFIELGCINGRTVAKADNSLFWCASDFTVRRLDGLTPVRVSTHAVEQWLRTATAVSLRACSYTLEGHIVYMLTADEGAWLFDITTGFWAERETYGAEPQWQWGNAVAFAGFVLVGSTVDGTIASLDPETYDELGDTMLMEATFQPVFAEGARAFHDRFEIVVATGQGLTTGQGSDPVALLSWSDDGGATFFNAPNKSLGPIGARQTRAVWHGLGSCASAHGRIYKIRVSDPIPVVIEAALLEVRGGRL